MPLINIQADLHGVVVQLKRIADLLEDYIHPAVSERHFDQSQTKVGRINIHSRWEAEVEDRKLRGVGEEVAGIWPRK